MPTYGEYWPKAAQRWEAMQRTKMTALTATAKKAVANKLRYQNVSQKTGVPWAVIAAIHMRESDMDFSTQLGQGDPLNQVSTHVPKGMGPYRGPDAWDRAAIEALEHDGLDTVKDWRIEKALYFCEKYNGWGYWNKGRVSPYVWAGSDQYISGKFVADGQYSTSAVDTQLGCAPLLKTIMELDGSAIFPREEGEGPAPQPEPIPQPTPIPTPEPLPVPLPQEPTMGALPWATIIPLVLRYAPQVFSLLPIVSQIIKDWPKIVAASPNGLGKLDIAALIEQFTTDQKT